MPTQRERAKYPGTVTEVGHQAWQWRCRHCGYVTIGTTRAEAVSFGTMHKDRHILDG